MSRWSFEGVAGAFVEGQMQAIEEREELLRRAFLHSFGPLGTILGLLSQVVRLMIF